MAGTQGLLAAVIASPDDLALRRVYADALIDAGDPRGEYIALACAGRPEADDLLARHRGAWDAALGPNVRDVEYRCGLAFRATLELGGDPPYLDALDRAPITSVALAYELDTVSRAVVDAIARDPRTRRITELNLQRFDTLETQAGILLERGDWPALRAVSIADADANEWLIRALVDANLPQLERLELRGDHAAHLADWIATLVTAPIAAQLRTLAMPNCSLGAPAAIELAAAPALSGLVALDLSGGSYATNRIGDAGLAGLAASPHLVHLERLGLGANELTDAGLVTLATSAGLPALADLAISHCPISARGFAALVEAPRFARIHTLWAAECPIGSDGARALAASPHARGLRSLNLRGCGIDAAGVHALLASPHLRGLAQLHIDAPEDARPALAARFSASR